VRGQAASAAQKSLPRWQTNLRYESFGRQMSPAPHLTSPTRGEGHAYLIWRHVRIVIEEHPVGDAVGRVELEVA
jgi:hypothetical protein